MSLKVKLISAVSLFMLMVGVLIIGVFSATQQTINLKGNVNFDVEDTTLYVNSVRIQTDTMGESKTLDNFMPGYINRSFDISVDNLYSSSNSVKIYFDVVNTTTTMYSATATGTNSDRIVSANGIINDEGISLSQVVSYKGKSGTIALTITKANGQSGDLDLNGITITINEYNPNVYEGFTFATNEDNTASLTKYEGNEANVVIPSTFSIRASNGAFIEGDDYTVTAIADGTSNTGVFYSERSTLTSVFIPDTITKIGDYAFASCSNLQSLNFPSHLQTIGNYAFNYCSNLEGNLNFPETLKIIGNNSFVGCSKLSGDLIIPNSVEEIGQWAFQSCSGFNGILKLSSSLTSIGNDTFDACSGLTGNLEIPEGIETIGMYAFIGCSNLTGITIPSTVTTIGMSAFMNCDKVTEINFNAKNMTDLTTSSRPFYNVGTSGSGITVNIGSTVKRIPAYLFYSFNNGTTNCAKVIELNISASVEIIGNHAFMYITTIKNINFENDSSLAEIESYAFAYLSSGLTTLTLPEGLETIGERAFQYCSSLKELVLPSSLNAIDVGAFTSCSNLNSVTFGSPNGWWYSTSADATSGTSITPSATALTAAYSNYYWRRNLEVYSDFEFNGHQLVSYTGTSTDVVIPGSYSIQNGQFVEGNDYIITSVTGVAFNNKTLSSLVIPASVAEIGFFDDFVALTKVIFEDNSQLTKIEMNAFFNCTNLQSINLDVCKNLTTIQENAFTFCENLKSITIPASVTELGDSAFSHCSNLSSVNFEEESKLKTIGESVFSRCDNLEEITIPASVTELYLNSFYECEKLTKITIEDPNNWFSNIYADLDASQINEPTKACVFIQGILNQYSEDYWFKFN